jgi:hypothetical protein
MLNRTALVFVALASILGFAFGGSVFWAFFNPPKAQHEQNSAHYAEYPSTENREKSQSLWVPTDSVGLYTLVLAAFTGLLFFTSVFQGYFLIRANQTALAAASAAKQSADGLYDAERPHMILSDIQISGAGLLPNAQSGVLLAITVRVTNYGRTPALLKSFVNYVSVGTELDPTPEYDPLVPIRFIIAPNHWYGTTRPNEIHLSAEMARGIVAGTERIWDCIFIQYEDPFGRPHKMRGAYRVDFGKDGRSVDFQPDGPDSYWEYT